jgi:hypothetical protein
VSSSRAQANHRLYLARILLAAWQTDLDKQQVAARTLEQAYGTSVREHLLDAYGWFLLTVSEPAVPLAQPPHSVAELPEVAEGKAIAGEVREFQQLEQAGWLAELLASQDAMPAQRSSRSPQNLAQAAPAQSGLQQFGDWAVQLEALFDRMGDSLDEY